MSPIATYPITRLFTGTINPADVDLAIATAVDAPAEGKYGCYLVGLHDDGSYCPAEKCGCVDTDARTEIWEGNTVTRGAWTWYGGRYALIGWHSTGPTRPELLERVAELEEQVAWGAEALAEEQELYFQANARANDDAIRIYGLQDELGEAERLRQALEASVEQLNTEAYDLRRRLPRLRGAAGLGWGLALVLAAALVWAVIA